MAKISGRSKTAPRATRAQGPIQTIDLTVTNDRGGVGFARDAKSELFLLAISNFVSEKTFHESAFTRDERYRNLVREVTRQDPDWVARFIPWLRNEANMRTASTVMAVETILARRGNADVAGRGHIGVRQIASSACSRADDPGEFIAYWIERTGSHTLPGGVQRGLGDAVTRLFSEYSAMKYDGIDQVMRLGDVVEMVHPTAKAPWQDHLFRYLLDRRHNPQEIRANLELLPQVSMWRAMQEVPEANRRARLASFDVKAAGMTWERLSKWIGGEMTAKVWESLIPSMPYMALLRNLRNFEQAGVSKETIKDVARIIGDPERVAKSRQFPYRFLSAYKEVSNLTFQAALEDALEASLSNIPVFKGRSLLLVDTSGSMEQSIGGEMSKMLRSEVAALFGLAVGKQSGVDVVMFGTTYAPFEFRKGSSVLPEIVRFRAENGKVGHSTETFRAITGSFNPAVHQRVIVITDEQHAGRVDVARNIPNTVPFYSFNVGGYRAAQSHSKPGRHTVGGLNDKAFNMIDLLERGQRADWPF